LYHPTAPINYVYGNETIRIRRKGSRHLVDIEYGFLVHNAGHTAVDTLNVLYPRSLYRKVDDAWEIDGITIVQEFDEVTRILPQLHSLDGDAQPQRLGLSIPNPRDPVRDLQLPIGDWLPQGDEFDCPGMAETEVDILTKWDLTFLQLRLGTPLKADDYRWFFFVVSHEVAAFRCVKGHMMHVQVASPVEVRNLAWELLQTAKNKAAAAHFRKELLRWYNTLANKMGLKKERPLKVGLYELNLRPGNPSQYHVDFFHLERDIYARSDSPRFDPAAKTLTYQFRSGEKLGVPSAGKGFHAFFQILSNR
jgi:hypothetical protein